MAPLSAGPVFIEESKTANSVFFAKFDLELELKKQKSLLANLNSKKLIKF